MKAIDEAAERITDNLFALDRDDNEEMYQYWLGKTRRELHALRRASMLECAELVASAVDLLRPIPPGKFPLDVLRQLKANNVQLVEALKPLATMPVDKSWPDDKSGTRFPKVHEIKAAAQALAANEDSGKMGELLAAVRKLERIRDDRHGPDWKDRIAVAADEVCDKAHLAGMVS